MRRKTPFASLLLFATSASAGSPPAPVLPEIDLVRVHKAERTVELWSAGRIVHVIEHIQLGGQPGGAKQFEGDMRTPEGRYVIDWGNPESAFHLSLHISYPDAQDLAFAALHDRPAGGMIMIHGQPNDLPEADEGARVPGDWTDGCIAVSNAEIEALWDAVPDGTPVEIEA